MFQERTYRNRINRKDLVPFRVVVKETDLFVHAGRDLKEITKELVLRYRGHIEGYIHSYPEFLKTLTPWPIRGPAPLIVRDMAAAGEKAGVGPMAAVAGAIAEFVGNDLLSYTEDVVVENGGDIFIKTRDPVIVGIYAGNSPLSMTVGLSVDAGNHPVSVCTSSGTVGDSLSMGKADAVSVMSESCSLSDAAATSIANQVKSKKDIQKAINFGRVIEGVCGIVVVVEDEIGVWGELSLVPIQRKKG